MKTLELQLKTKNIKQAKCAEAWADDSTEQILYGGAKGGGKSFIGANLIFADALTYPGTHYFIARQELNDLRKFTIPTIHEVFGNWGLKLDDYADFNGQDNCYNLLNGSKIYLIACKEIPSDPLYERFGSMQMTRGWIEEGGEVAEAAKANLWLSIGRWKNKEYNLKKKLLITCNPKKNWMKREFVDPWKNDLLDKTKQFIQAFATDNTYLPQDYIDTLATEKDTVRRERLYKGNWDYDDDQTALLTDRDIQGLFTNPGEAGQRYMTIDPAFMGKDKAVIYIWNGYICEKAYVFDKIDHETMNQMVDLYMQVDGVPRRNTVSDATGEGAYIPKFLKGVRGFIGASSPLEYDKAKYDEMRRPFFNNLRSQCIWEMAQLIKSGKVAFKIDNQEIKNKLIEELEQWKVKEVDNDKKVAIVSKEDIREQIGRSTDYSDALYERVFFDLDTEHPSYSPTLERRQNDVMKAVPFNPYGI